MKKYVLLSLLCSLGAFNALCQLDLKLKFKVADSLQNSFHQGGRILIHLTKKTGTEPRSKSEMTIGYTANVWDLKKDLVIHTKNKEVNVYGMEKLKVKKGDMIYVQAVYKQNENDGQENVEGNLSSQPDSFRLGDKILRPLVFQQTIQAPKVIDHPLVKTIKITSKYLTEFSGRPRTIKASILLPSDYYENTGKVYPICYRAPGLNGRWHAVNNLLTKDKEFSELWFSKTGPKVIYVFLDSMGPYGDTYQVDSENNGPCGKALTEELIPAIEKMVGYNPANKMRFLAGCSTGGWVVMGLQIFYPDFFDGAWSYSPDPLEFEHYGLINIYEDETIFYNKYGYLQPGNRNVYGEPTRSMKDWIENENVNSRTNNYLISGGQFGAYNAVFGPKGKDGLPSLMFDPKTGKVDKEIAKQWEKYDLKKYLSANWPTIGPKLQGKLWIWSGDCDGLFSNVSTRFFKEFIDKTTNPKSDAHISFTAMAGHCQEWNDEDVIKMIAAKVGK